MPIQPGFIDGQKNLATVQSSEKDLPPATPGMFNAFRPHTLNVSDGKMSIATQEGNIFSGPTHGNLALDVTGPDALHRLSRNHAVDKNVHLTVARQKALRELEDQKAALLEEYRQKEIAAVEDINRQMAEYEREDAREAEEEWQNYNPAPARRQMPQIRVPSLQQEPEIEVEDLGDLGFDESLHEANEVDTEEAAPVRTLGRPRKQK